MKKHTFFGKKLATFICMILCLSMVFGVVACSPSGGGGLDENKVNLLLQAATDGHGVAALKLQAERFNEAFGDKPYTDPETGKEYSGAHLTISELSGTNPPNPSSGWLQEGYTMYHASTEFSSVDAAVTQGYAANIDYILRKTIPGETQSVYDKLGADSRYYYSAYVSGSNNPNKLDLCAIPYGQSISGFIYDRDLFNGEIDGDTGEYVAETGYYLSSADDPAATAFTSEIIPGALIGEEDFTLYFTNGDSTYKTVGSNGNGGDYDDGLPSSFLEFIVLCEKLADDGVPVFTYSGQTANYMNLGLHALLFSMLGYDNALAMSSFNSSSLNVVTGFTDDNFFLDDVSSDIDVRTPVVTQVPMTESSGYYHTWTLERYLCMALVELIMDNTGWRSYSADNSHDNKATQRNFVFGDVQTESRGAILSEGSFWFNEAIETDVFEDYELLGYGTMNDRDVAWMPLPVNVYASVTGENKTVTFNNVTESVKGEAQTLNDTFTNALMVNARYADDKVIMQAVEDYLLFIASNDELNKFAKDAGYTKGLSFTYDEEIMSDAPNYVQETFKIFEQSNVVTMFSQTPSWQKRESGTLDRYFKSHFFNERTDNKLISATTASILFIQNKGAVKAFENNLLAREHWAAFYKTGAGHEPTTAATYPNDYHDVSLRGEQVVYNYSTN